MKTTVEFTDNGRQSERYFDSQLELHSSSIRQIRVVSHAKQASAIGSDDAKGAAIASDQRPVVILFLIDSYRCVVSGLVGSLFC